MLCFITNTLYHHYHFVCLLHTNNDGCGAREAHINWSMLVTEKAARVTGNYLDYDWPCADGLSAVNAVGTQLRDPINSGLAR